MGSIGSQRTDEFFSNLAAQLRLVFASVEDEQSFQARWLDRDQELAQLITAGQQRRAQSALARYLADSETQVVDAIRAECDT